MTQTKKEYSKIEDVPEIYPPFWLRKLGMGMSPKNLERYCDQLCELVPATDQKKFEFYKGYARDLKARVDAGLIKQSEAAYLYLIALSMAAGFGTEAFLVWKVSDAKCEAIFKKFTSRAGKENFFAITDEELIRNYLKELKDKSDKFFKQPCLLPSEGLLTLR